MSDLMRDKAITAGAELLRNRIIGPTGGARRAAATTLDAILDALEEALRIKADVQMKGISEFPIGGPKSALEQRGKELASTKERLRFIEALRS